jgi:hypothetical protein
MQKRLKELEEAAQQQKQTVTVTEGAADASSEQETSIGDNSDDASDIMSNAQDKITAMMQSDVFKEKLMALKDDPELKPMFEALKEKPDDFMKFFKDEEFLRKFGEKMGDVPMKAMGMETAEATEEEEEESSPAAAAPEAAKNLVDAAKIGDVKATQEFLAAGEDPNFFDSERRTALHYAAGKGLDEVVVALIAGKADVNAVDPQGNTALHYAAGYGQAPVVLILLDAGAKPSLQNNAGKSVAEVTRMNKGNKVLEDAELMARLDETGDSAASS